MQISEEILEKIKEQNDIVDVISESVRLKRSGRNFSGLCPFHNEKTPSFSVSQDKQIYKCFGCGEAGNVITFVMKTKNLPFVDAVKYLGERVNITIEDGNKGKSPITKKKEMLYNVNVEAARFFFRNLMSTSEAKDYFLNRGIKEETMKRFGLGFAKESWNNLLLYLRKRGFNEEILLEAGLVSTSQKTGNKYDRFRNRVIFPVFDYRGKVIGFGGRVLDDSKPKYLNSPETLVFQKGTNLYGLNFAIKSNLKERYFIIVEGYMDLITLHQYGITNVVASLGTALTTNQARLLKRYADKVIISYDADIAGQTATLRGLEILKDAGFEVRVLNIPQGKDPDEFVRSNGKEAFKNLIKNAEPLIDYRLKRAEEGINFKESDSLAKYGKRVTNILAKLNPVEKDVYVKKISENTGIREQALYDLLSSEMTKNINNDKFMNNKEYNGTKLYVEPGFLKAERSLMKLMLEDDYFEYIINILKEEDLILEEHKEIFSIIKDGKMGRINNIMSFVESKCNNVKTLEELVKIKEHNVFKVNDSKKLIKDFIKQIDNYKLNLRLEDLKKQQKLLEAEGKIEESIHIAIELTKIAELLKRGVRE
ncbi:DNA primase [Clostridium chauvoei]|uniref:DNA primase n=1 Tax=Clostridium chauvoei JF4335 TaxID=1351755 RepID=A0A1U6J6K6_9CLOT|nr:DNA primase [Clostridium chauvoei]ATD54715.1 DNA primase [Clostridium chauvoei]ATD57603.1 DNA primase [Clostridium chauvoei]MBX7280013.1 DNA primase [Clostridium chauvoei]MBX7282328.1 DNA primase [Clostridium chauvoei]MBX7284904.1 DNA primase [Clostridium chauvoei]